MPKPARASFMRPAKTASAASQPAQTLHAQTRAHILGWSHRLYQEPGRAFESQHVSGPFACARLSWVDLEGVKRTTIDHSAEERFVSLRKALGVTSFGINQIILQPGQRLRIHRHGQQEEVYLVVRGSLGVIIEGEEELELGEGELARVPASIRRQLVNRFPGPCTIVAIGASGDHQSRDAEAFVDWSDSEGRPPQDVPLPVDLPGPSWSRHTSTSPRHHGW